VRTLVIVASVVLMGFAPAPLPRQRQREAEPDVTGTWQIVLWEEDGERIRNFEERLQVEMKKGSFVLVWKAYRREMDGFTMRLEPRRSPPAFTWSVGNRTLFVGSYRLYKDELTMILTSDDRLEARPTDFEGKPEIRLVLRRVTP
jgi:uncharacterized protein (TIGR03067 family)